MTNSIVHTMNDRCLKKDNIVFGTISTATPVTDWSLPPQKTGISTPFVRLSKNKNTKPHKHSMNPHTAIKISLICCSEYSPNKTTIAINSSISQGMVSSAAGMRKGSICHNRLDPISSRNTRSPNPFPQSISLSIFPSRIPSSCQNVLNLYAK